MQRILAALLIGSSTLAACSPDEARKAPAGSPAGEVASAAYAAKGWAAKSLPEIAVGLADGQITSEAITQGYLDRIAEIDRKGPTLRSVLTVNPRALDDARASDARRAANMALGPLDGVPILLKDNIESADPMPTTAGALALKDNLTGRDSPLVAGLRAQGAIILGKTNLSQWANFRSNDSMSGWSALGGQVRNPHILDRNPCGSSSGSGVAVAASLAAGAVGTETNGSISCPSTVNGVVGFKPTVGLVAQDLIVPISSTQDTAGPMTKTVTGAAMMLNAMATGAAKTDYVAALDANSLTGTRIGVARFAQGSHPGITSLFNAALRDLEAAGAALVEIEKFEPAAENFWSKTRLVLNYEFKATLNDYLASTPDAVATRSLQALIDFNNQNADVELALFDQSIFEAAAPLGDLQTTEYVEARADVLRATRENGIDKMLADNDVDFIVSPSGPLAPPVDAVNGDVWPAWAGAGYLAAIAGYPHLTVPMGTEKGLPVGLSFIGGKDQDAAILSYGFAYEQRTNRRVDPQYLPTAETLAEVGAAMSRRD